MIVETLGVSNNASNNIPRYLTEWGRAGPSGEGGEYVRSRQVCEDASADEKGARFR